jgi:hypothetical protein
MTLPLYGLTVRGDKALDMSELQRVRPIRAKTVLAPLFSAASADEDRDSPPSGVHAIDDAVREGREVTLIVYGWKSVEPGTLWWVFPSLSTALAAARAMTNAVRWAIVPGSRGEGVDVDEERACGAVLVEAPG